MNGDRPALPRLRTIRWTAAALAACAVVFACAACVEPIGGSPRRATPAPATAAPSWPIASASIAVDAGKVLNRISPALYGQFIEYMFEGIKNGFHAELLALCSD